MVDEHQCEQPARLRLPRGQRQLAGEPDRLAGDVDPAACAGRVDEGQHTQHDGEIARLVEARPCTARLARLIRCAIVASGT